jgi:hypothetical protein
LKDGTIVAASRSELLRIPASGGNPEVIKLVTSGDVNISPDGSHMTVATSVENKPVLRALGNLSTFLKTAK